MQFKKPPEISICSTKEKNPLVGLDGSKKEGPPASTCYLASESIQLSRPSTAKSSTKSITASKHL